MTRLYDRVRDLPFEVERATLDGRAQLHALARLYYPGGPNDVVPAGYNAPEPHPDVEPSPFSPPERPGLGL